MPAYGLAENTLFVSGRQEFGQPVKIIRIDVNKMRSERVVEVVSDDDYNKRVAENGDPTSYQRLVGCGPPGVFVDGKLCKTS